MENERAETIEEALAGLREAANLSRLITQAGAGDDAAIAALLDMGSIEMEFPGNRQRAMGHALVYIEDLEEVGIAARREYGGVSEEANGTTLHRIDIVIEGESAEADS